MLGRLPDLLLFIPMQSTYFAFCFCLVFPPDPNKSREISTLGKKCTFYRILSSTWSLLWHRLLREVWERIDDQSTATTTVCANTECEPRFTSLKHRKQKLRQYIYASLKMCSFGQLFSSLNIILITLELKIIGESCVIIRLNIMTVN